MANWLSVVATTGRSTLAGPIFIHHNRLVRSIIFPSIFFFRELKFCHVDKTGFNMNFSFSLIQKCVRVCLSLRSRFESFYGLGGLCLVPRTSAVPTQEGKRRRYSVASSSLSFKTEMMRFFFFRSAKCFKTRTKKYKKINERLFRTYG